MQLYGSPRVGVAIGIAVIAVMASGAGAQNTVRLTPGHGLQQAVDAAGQGDTLVLAAGEHHGPVTVPQGVSLRGEEGAAVIGMGRGSVITVAGDNVSIANLEVRGSGHDLSGDDAGILVLADGAHIANVKLRENLHGIYVRLGKAPVIRDNEIIGLAASAGHLTTAMAAADAHAHDEHAGHDAPPRSMSLMGNGIHLFDADGARVERNRIQYARDGIYVAHTSDAEFRRNRISDSRYGIHYMYSSENVIADNELYANVAGPAIMFSHDLQITGNLMRDHAGFRAYGLLLQEVDHSVIHDNEIRGNRVGMRMQNSNANDFRRNRLVGNLAGATITSSSRDNTFTRNHFGYNLRQMELTGPTPPNAWSVDGVGNEWWGALPMDLTGDGVSEWPHNEVDLMADRRERFPVLSLLAGSIGVRVLEWALSRAPAPGTRYITDPHPLLRARRTTASQ